MLLGDQSSSCQTNHYSGNRDMADNLCLGTFSEYTHYVDKVSGRSTSPGHLAPVNGCAIHECVFSLFATVAAML